MLKPYYQDDYATIYHGDCLNILPELSKVDLVLTDPPYGVKYAEWDELVNFKWLEICREKSSVVMVMCGNENMFKYPEPLWVGSWFRPGSVQRAAGGGFSHWDPILIYGKNPLNYDAKQIAATFTDKFKGDHPCPKPIKLLSWLINENEVDALILDPFMGSGTTLRAAKDLQRKSIGIEIEKKYCEIAAQRLSQEVLALR